MCRVGWHSETTANEGMIPLSRAHSSQLDGSRGYDVQPDGHADNELSSEPENSHSSLREQRLVQRWAERQERQERRPSINTNTRATDAPHERAACLELDFEKPGPWLAQYLVRVSVRTRATAMLHSSCRPTTSCWGPPLVDSEQLHTYLCPAARADAARPNSRDG